MRRVHVFNDLASRYASDYLAGLDVTEARDSPHVMQLSMRITADWQQRTSV